MNVYCLCELCEGNTLKTDGKIEKTHTHTQLVSGSPTKQVAVKHSRDRPVECDYFNVSGVKNRVFISSQCFFR